MSDEYMTVDETLAHIMRVEKCSRRTAMRKLRKALEDRELGWRFATDEEEEQIGGKNGEKI